MKVPLSWLREYVDVDCSAYELADKLTMAGHEVESVEEVGAGLAGIITVRVDKIEPHPNADRLVVTSLFDGKDHHQVVTGATNLVQGCVVPMSPPGSVLINHQKMKKAKLRGVPSFGMLCSEAEFGVVSDSEGIWILDSSTPLGVDFVEYAHLTDWVLDIAVLPNRGDCLSLLGIAREVAVLFNTTCRVPDHVPDVSSETVTMPIVISAKERCSYYSGMWLENISDAQTPLMMRRRLQLVDIKPISFIVDVTNYVMMEMGQPLHAFAGEDIDSEGMDVRYAVEEELFTGLDGSEKNLRNEDLVISSGGKAIALAGVMGGQNSGMRDGLDRVLLESAIFDPVGVRRTASYHGVRTESSIRFEKSVDPLMVQKASSRAAYLIQSVLKDVSVRPFLEAGTCDEKVQELLFDSDGINQLLGSGFSQDEMVRVFDSLGFECDGDRKRIKVPSWRKRDVRFSACLAEEVGRILGFDHIPSSPPLIATVQSEPAPILGMIEQFRSYFNQHGFMETVTLPMVGQDDCDVSSALEIQNPINQKEGFMRTSLLPSLLKVVLHNQRNGMKCIRLFETARVYGSEGEQDWGLAVFSLDRMKSPYFSRDKEVPNMDFFDIKALMEGALAQWPVHVVCRKTESPFLFPDQAMDIMSNDHELGYFGLIHPSYLKQYRIKSRLGVIAVNLAGMELLCNTKVPQFTSIPRYPSTRRDVALLVDKELPYESIYQAFWAAKPDLLVAIDLFDYFESDQFPQGKIGMGIGFTYQSDTGTLMDQDVDPVHESYVANMLDQLPISFR